MRILQAVAIVAAGLIPGQVNAAPPLCAKNIGNVTQCRDDFGGNSADFAGSCSSVPQIVYVECESVYEEVSFTRHQAMENCNRDAYDPNNWRYWGSGCNFDPETAYRTCLAAGYDGVKSIKQGKWSKPKDNGITKWEPLQGRFVAYAAREQGNKLIDKLVCWRNRYLTY